MKKFYNLAPGPTEVPPELLLASAKPTIHHRTKEFSQLFKSVSSSLKSIFKTQNDVYILVSSGTGAMEMAVANVLSASDKAYVIDAGKFGERWGQICKTYGVDTYVEKLEWGSCYDVSMLENYLSKNPDCHAVFTQLSESASASTLPIKEIAQITARYPDCVLVVDAVSGLLAQDIRMDEWGVDVLLSGSQKALMLPPGLAFISFSPKAERANERSTLPKFYFDYKKYKKNLEKDTSPFTMAVNMIYALQWSLRRIEEEGGVDTILEKTQKYADAFRAGVQAIGLKLLSSCPVNGLTAVVVPEGIDGKKLKEEFFTRFGITIAGGQDKYAGKIIRVAHMGYFAPSDVILALSALEMLLFDMGYKLELGRGVATAERLLYKGC